MLLNNAAWSIALYYLLSCLFEITFGNINWKATGFTAFLLSVLFFVYAPSNLYTLGIMRYSALVWLLIQGLVVIDIAHEVHLYIIKRAELAYNFRGLPASKPWYTLHIVLSVILLLITATLIEMLIGHCGLCSENKIVIGITIWASILSTCYSLREQHNKGGLIPAIIATYATILCCSALLSNPDTLCTSMSTEGSNEDIYRYTAKAIVNWLLLLTVMACMTYAAVTGSPSVVLMYKAIQQGSFLKSRSANRNAGINFNLSTLCCCADLTDKTNVELDLDSNVGIHSPYASDKDESDRSVIVVEEGSEYLAAQRKSYNDGFKSISVLHFDRTSVGASIVGASSSGAGVDQIGESTSLLRDHHRLLVMSSDPDSSPCSSISADELWQDNSVLFKIQLAAANCLLAMTLTNWSALDSISTSSSNSISNSRQEYEAMYIKITGVFFVWFLFALVLHNSYLIYSRHNQRLRAFINI